MADNVFQLQLPTRSLADVVLPLQQGASGDAVAQLHQLLTQAGLHDGDEEGSTFGPGTEQAVRNLQAGVSLPRTGVVDQLTWDRLNALATSAPQGGVDIQAANNPSAWDKIWALPAWQKVLMATGGLALATIILRVVWPRGESHSSDGLADSIQKLIGGSSTARCGRPKPPSQEVLDAEGYEVK